MNCTVCSRCGKCDAAKATQIADDGLSELAVRFRPRPGLGLSADLGTTTIVARVYDLTTGAVVRTARAYNPQRAVAADVMGRIAAAADADERRRLGEMLRSTLAACRGGLPVTEAVVVGNTAMLGFLVNEDPSPFATAPFQAKRLFGERIELDGVPTLFPRCAHAFFGADAVAAILASGLCSREDTELFIDIGTNGELALRKDGRLTVTSVAAGPAFERPGISGSTLVSALADALANGSVDATGLAVGPLADGLTQSDIRAVQLAKAAMAAGFKRLLALTDTRLSEVKRLSIAGGFGRALDLAKAARVGLFPSELLPVAHSLGNLAIEGASALLLDPTLADDADRLARQSVHLELGGDPLFSDLFISSMSFS